VFREDNRRVNDRIILVATRLDIKNKFRRLFQTYLGVFLRVDTNSNLTVGQLEWRWFRSDRPLEDMVKYDSESRGPLGAVTLLWRLGLLHPLSSCGALITIIMLFVDPFAQQVIRVTYTHI